MVAAPLPVEFRLVNEVLTLLRAEIQDANLIEGLRGRVKWLQKKSPSNVILLVADLGLDILQGQYSKIQPSWIEIQRILHASPSEQDVPTYANVATLAMLGGELKLAVSIHHEALAKWPSNPGILWKAGLCFDSLGMAFMAHDIFERYARSTLSVDKTYIEVSAANKNTVEMYKKVGVSDDECLLLTAALHKAIANAGYYGSEIGRKTSYLDEENPLSIYIVYSAPWLNYEAAAKVWENYKDILVDMSDKDLNVLEKVCVDITGTKNEVLASETLE